MRFYSAIAALFLVAAGCGSTPGGAPGATQGNEQSGIPIQVENSGSNPLRVFAVIGDQESLLGRVDALRTTNLYLPEGVTGQMQLVVRPNASRGFGEAHNSQPFTVQSGQRVRWELRGGSAAFYVPQISTISIMTCEPEERC
jgi:FtsP/CotA-like multicopper oxidase with cupredoxin domain